MHNLLEMISKEAGISKMGTIYKHTHDGFSSSKWYSVPGFADQNLYNIQAIRREINCIALSENNDNPSW